MNLDFQYLQRRRGGAALEYIIVSIFAGAIAISSIIFVSHFAKTKLEWLKEQFQLDDDVDIFPDLSD